MVLSKQSPLTDLRYSMHAQLLMRMLCVMIMYTLCRLIFFAYNYDLLGIDNMATLWRILSGGLRFDLAALIYTNALVILLSIIPFGVRYRAGYQRVLSWVFMLCNAPAIILNLGDVVYYRFSGRRTTLSVLDEFAGENGLGFLRFLASYWGITLVGLGLLCLLWWLAFRFYVTNIRPSALAPRYYYPLSILASLLLIVGCVGGVRGGFRASTRPIAPSAAAAYTQRPEQVAMVQNTPFTMIRLADKVVLPAYQYMDEAEASKLFDPLRISPEQSPRTGQFAGRNVVIIIWESLAREWIGSLNRDIDGYQGYTPFVDELIDRSYTFGRAYAGGGKSIDAMPAILASVPRPQSPFVLSPYSGNRLSSIVDAVAEQGYYTAFFHNAHRGSMGFDAMAQQLGYKHYYGLEDYGDQSQFDGKWGIWDEPFLQYMVKTLSGFPQPFLATEFTTSSHEPFDIPKEYEATFPKGRHPMHRSIAYSDMALRRFFQAARQTDWYDNTLFVITADHAVAGDLQEYKNSAGLYSIPIIFFDPRGSLIGLDQSTVVQQADIVPTLVDLLGIQRPMVSFGHNMFNPSEPHMAVSTLDGAYQLIQGDYALHYDGVQTLGLYNLKQDRMMRRNLKDTETQTVAQMERVMQAWLQSFSYRMRENKLTP